MRDFFNNTVKHINNMDPARIMVIGFAVVILLGALLLNLPIATQDGQSIGFLNALFTSTSAVCVTGLTTVIPIEQFTIVGQIILLALIAGTIFSIKC